MVSPGFTPGGIGICAASNKQYFNIGYQTTKQLERCRLRQQFFPPDFECGSLFLEQNRLEL